MPRPVDKQKLLVVVGPTASGKTEAGIRLARERGGEVICADSRTVYRGMDIGTAKVQGERGGWGMGDGNIQSLFEQPLVVDGIPHWGLNLVDPDETYSAAQFQEYADRKIREIAGRGKLPLLVGGTGLYVRAVVDRPTFAEVPPNAARRTELEAMGDEALLELLGELDPDAAADIDVKNRRRVVRAIEILEATGKPLAESRSKNESIYDAEMIGLDIDRPELVRRIDERVDRMIASGLIDEARALYAKYGADAPGMTSIGYRQLCDFFAGKTKLRDAVERIKIETRQYAKRQMTWFKADSRVRWVRWEKQVL